MNKKKIGNRKTKGGSKASLWIHGISGRMGQEISELLAADKELSLLGGSDQKSKLNDEIENADIIVDFSSTAGNLQLQKHLAKFVGKKVLIGTTGLSSSALNSWKVFARNKENLVILAPNTSFGIYTMAISVGSLAKKLADQNWSIEIVEAHHSRKLDAPSGTANLLARMIQKECPKLSVTEKHASPRRPDSIGIHSIRGGGIVGEHEVRFIGPQEEICVSHRAFSRSLFAHGAIGLCKSLLASNKSGFFMLEDFH